MATMKDVARLAGVSIATVSAALSGSSFVSAELKDRVLAAVANLGYAPNAMARGLKRGRSSLIGLVVPDITNPFFTEFVHAIQSRAQAANFTVLLGVSGDLAEREAELVRLMRSHQAAASIVIPCGDDGDCASLARYSAAMPIVAVDNAPPGLAFDAVVLDNRKAAELATRHILSFGHFNVAAVNGPAHRFVSRERWMGFLRQLEANGLPVPPERIMQGGFHVRSAHDAALALLDLKPRPTAIFVSNNQMLIGVMQALAEVRLKVPRDISIAAIDDFPWASAFTPALTTVRQPIDSMAEAAFKLVVTRIDGDSSPPQRLVFEPELVVRDSCVSPS